MPKYPILNFKKKRQAKFDAGKLWFVLLLLILINILWDSPVLYPFILFATLVHEACHALMAIITHGQAHTIEIAMNTSGLTLTSGGLPFLVYSAGYVGTAVVAGLMIMLDQRPNTNKLALYSIGGFCIFVTLWLVRNPFGFVFGLVFGAALIYLAIQKWPAVHHWTIRGLAIYLMANSVSDIVRLPAIHRTGIETDATLLFKHYLIPPIVSVIVWFVISVVVIFFALRVSLEEK